MRFMEINLPVVFLKEGKRFIAYTPALDLSTCANTFKKAQKRFEELVTIFFEELEKKGTLDEVLTECGWRKLHTPKGDWIPPRFIGQTQETIKVSCHG
jgi:hypothetical protein